MRGRGVWVSDSGPRNLSFTRRGGPTSTDCSSGPSSVMGGSTVSAVIVTARSLTTSGGLVSSPMVALGSRSEPT